MNRLGHLYAKTRTLPRALAMGLMLFMLLISPGSAQQPDATPPGGGAEREAESEEARKARLARRQDLLENHGYSEAMLDDRAALILARAHLEAIAATLDLERDATRERLTLARGERRSIEKQASNPSYPPLVRQTLTVELARSHVDRARDESLAALIAANTTSLRAESRLLEEYVASLHEADVQSRQSELERLKAEEERRKREEGERRTAQAELEEIQAKKAAAKNEQLRDLLTEQSKLAERVVQLTDKKGPHEQKLAEKADASAKAFAQRRDELLVFIEQLPKEVKDKKKQEKVDQTFVKVRDERKQTRDQYLALTSSLPKLKEQLDEAESTLAAAKRRLADAQSQGDASATELGKARAALATTELKLAQLERDIIHLDYQDALTREKMLIERLTFYEEELELLLPRITDARDADFYSLTSDRNWQEARKGLRLALMRVSRHIRSRVDRAVEIASDPLSISLWAWVGGFIWRLFLVMVALYLARTRGQAMVRKLTEMALQRRMFRQNPNFTIKSGEVLGHVLSPLVLFGSITYLIFYVRGILPEARYVQWAINAVFIFRITAIIVSVMILPRTVREPGKVVQGDWEDEEAPGGVDVLSIEVNRARKLVRSAKVVIWFWLIVFYVPEAVLALMGHSVIWRIVDIATTWGFILVIYSVLSTWRDDIARGFERLAIDRLPRAVQFVNDNKDRIWGVLVIGVASIYVIGHESVRLGKRYLLDTEWSKRINNFIFRKRVELQQRDQAKKDAQGVHDALQMAALPSHFRELFEDVPLTDEVFRIDLAQDLPSEVVAHYVAWLASKKQGSIAVVGESGVGKSTALHQISGRLFAAVEGSDTEPISAQFVDKITTRSELILFLSKLFELDDVPSDKPELIKAIMAVGPTAILLDDCHNLFLRRISGFEAMELFLEVVNLTDGKHFWVLTFNHFSWSYLTRVKRREHYFGQVITMAPWTESDIEELISKRTMMTGCKPNFTDLVVTRDEGEDISFEVVKSARGYFRLLHEFCKGNPRVALLYWLRSLKPGEHEDIIQVGLFKMPPPRVTIAMADNYWFALTAIAQHGSLNTQEIADIVNTDVGFCAMALNYFDEMDIIELDESERASLRPLYFRQVLKHLTDSNYLYD